MQVKRGEHADIADRAGIFPGTFAEDFAEGPERRRLPQGDAPDEPPQQLYVAQRDSEKARRWSILAGAPVQDGPVEQARDCPHPPVIRGGPINPRENCPVIRKDVAPRPCGLEIDPARALVADVVLGG